MANASLILLPRLLLIVAMGLVWQVSHAQTPNYQPVIQLDASDLGLGEPPVSEEADRNVFLSMLSRAQTAGQLAAALSFDKAGEDGAMADVGIGVGMSTPASAGSDGLVGLLVVALLVWYFSFRR